jgi:hypothetical protein
MFADALPIPLEVVRHRRGGVHGSSEAIFQIYSVKSVAYKISRAEMDIIMICSNLVHRELSIMSQYGAPRAIPKFYP